VSITAVALVFQFTRRDAAASARAAGRL
jgi:hypothetical protein